MDLPNLLSALGVGLILVAFFLLTFKIVAGDSRIYYTLNLLGGVLATCGAWLIGAMPFVVLEVTWTVVAVIGLYKSFKISLKDDFAKKIKN